MMQYHDILQAYQGGHAQDAHAQLWGRKLAESQEISGIPPLIFYGFGKNLKDYRIYGNSAQNGTPAPDAPADVVGCGERTKNLLDDLKTTTTTNGVTFTVDNASGTVNANGRATGNAIFTINIPSITGNFYYSGCPVGGGSKKYDIYPWDSTLNTRPTDWNGNPTSAADNDFGEGMSKLKVIDGHSTLVVCRIYSGYNAQNIVFRPMLRIPSESNAFEPYGYKIPVTCGGETKNIYLGGTPLMQDEFISFSEQKIYRKTGGVLTPADPPVPLPVLPTLSGTNILTVETSVQPSAVYLRGKIKTIS